MKKFFKFVQAKPWALITTPLAGLTGYLTLESLGADCWLLPVFVGLSIWSYFKITQWHREK